VVVPVDHVQPLPWGGGGLPGDRTAEPGRAWEPQRTRTGAVIFASSAVGTPQAATKNCRKRGVNALPGPCPTGALQLCDHLRRLDDLGHPERDASIGWPMRTSSRRQPPRRSPGREATLDVPGYVNVSAGNPNYANAAPNRHSGYHCDTDLPVTKVQVIGDRRRGATISPVTRRNLHCVALDVRYPPFCTADESCLAGPVVVQI
jgi:hypothetical protein